MTDTNINEPFLHSNIQRDNVAARERLEYDWSDKKDAFEIETVNCRLNNKSTTSLLRPGATRFLDELRLNNLVIGIIFIRKILNETFAHMIPANPRRNIGNISPNMLWMIVRSVDRDR